MTEPEKFERKRGNRRRKEHCIDYLYFIAENEGSIPPEAGKLRNRGVGVLSKALRMTT